MIDDNIRDSSGHYLELAHLLGGAAKARGFQTILATHKQFLPDSETEAVCKVYPLFDTPSMLHWSLGIDGISQFARNLNGRIQNRSVGEHFLSCWQDIFCKRSRRPSEMIMNWKRAFLKVIDSLDLTEHDHLVLNTANDFVILATASALQDRKSKKLNIHAIFHFATNHADTAHGRQRNAKMGQQMNMALGALGHHQVYIHTTTEELKAEINSVMDHEIANAIPYPTRSSETTIDLEDQPCNAMLAGMPRSEKGKHSIRGFLQALENRNLIGDTTYRPCLQVPGKHWKSLIPNSLHSSCDTGRVELITKHLSTIEYHQWIGGAGLGIFLYDPVRYRSRCSGVLLEMLTRGVPVIVPDHCWLANQFKKACIHGPVGYVYQQVDEIPDLMCQFLSDREQITGHARAYAPRLREDHKAENTLLKMGLQAT